MTDELRPCPFCDTASPEMNEDDEGFVVHCTGCNARGPTIFYEYEDGQEDQARRESIAAWNRRAGDE